MNINNNVINLIIVAHQDDESIWAADILNSTCYVLVICGKNKDHNITKIRNIEIKNAMNIIKCEYEVCDFYDKKYRWDDIIKKNIEIKIINTINNFPSLQKIYTHNEYGEYGHQDHIRLHYIVKQICEHMYNQKKLYFFNPRIDYEKIQKPNNIKESYSFSAGMLEKFKNKNISYATDSIKRTQLLDQYNSQTINIFRNILIEYKSS